MTFQPDQPNGVRNIVILWISIYLILMVLFLFCTKVVGSEYPEYPAKSRYSLFSVEQLDVLYAQMRADSRDPYTPEYTGRWKGRAAIQWRVSAMGALYWDNDCHVETIDNGVVATVGWKWELGLRVTKQVSIFNAHHSRHSVESMPEKRFESVSQFPVDDSYGIRIHFILGGKEGASIWK